jgi:CBS domain-containing protein
MAESIINTAIPEGAQKFKSNFDIKLLTLPIVDLARLYALKNQISNTNTVKRINLAYDKNIFSQSGHINLLQIYNFLMEIRFRHQITQISEHITPDNIIDPHRLSDVDLVIVKKAISVIEDFQNKVRLDFKGTLAR